MNDFHTGGWFAKQSPETLQDLVNGNGPENTDYIGAMAELARREAKRTNRQQLWWIRAAFWVAVAAVVATVSLWALDRFWLR